MLGWEEVDWAQIPITLGGYLPIRAISGIMDIIIWDHVNVQLCDPPTFNLHLKFHNWYYLEIEEGAKVGVNLHEDQLALFGGMLMPTKMK